MTKSELEEYKKSICKHCWGKGYSTRFYGVTASEDFGGDGGVVEPMKVHIQYCVCDRGEQLQKVIETKEKEVAFGLLKRINRAVNVKKQIDTQAKNAIKLILKGYWKAMNE